MTKPAFNPEMESVEVFGSDGSRYLQGGVFYGAAPDYRPIGDPMYGQAVQPPEEFELVTQVDGDPVIDPAAPAAAPEVVAPNPAIYTFEQLEEMDMPALREIGDAWGVKGRSKADLVAEINAAQAKAAAE